VNAGNGSNVAPGYPVAGPNLASGTPAREPYRVSGINYKITIAG